MKDRLDLVENLIEKEGIGKIEISKFIDAGDSIILRDAYGGVSRELVYRSAHTDCIKLMESIYGNNYK